MIHNQNFFDENQWSGRTMIVPTFMTRFKSSPILDKPPPQPESTQPNVADHVKDEAWTKEMEQKVALLMQKLESLQLENEQLKRALIALENTEAAGQQVEDA
jgi:hypothetical protein